MTNPSTTLNTRVKCIPLSRYLLEACCKYRAMAPGRGQRVRHSTRGPLQVIAQKNCLTPYLDNFVALDKFLNLRQLIVKFGRNRLGNDNRLAPKSTSPQFQPFASLLFCSQDNSCMAQLTYNTRVQCITLSRYLRYPT